MKTIDEKIVDLGDSFRGLWLSKIVNTDNQIKPAAWTVTFVYKSEMVETNWYDNPHAALDSALSIMRT